MNISFRPKSAYLTSLLAGKSTSANGSSISKNSPFRHGLDTVSINAGCLSHLKELGGQDTNTKNVNTDSGDIFESSRRLPIIYVRKGERQPLSDSARETIQKTIESLKSELEKDESFVKSNSRSIFRNPVAQQLATAMILGDPELQDQMAKTIWNDWNNSNLNAKLYPDLNFPCLEIPEDYHDIDIPAMLRSRDKQTVTDVLFAFDSVMVKKAFTTGLTDTERLLSSSNARIDFYNHATFDDKVGPVLEQIEKEFHENGLEFDKDKSYSFTLDTSDFTFRVSGGTEQENELMAKVVNTKNIWGHSYDIDNMNTIIFALLAHRREDGSYNPWSSTSKMDTEEKAAEIREHGIADTPKEYVEKMKQLKEAYSLYRSDESMKRFYGIGVNDLEYKNGQIIGKTPEVATIIEKGSYDFMKEQGFAYIELMKNYTGTPTFETPVFTLDGGKFHVTYNAD
ncbi:hypothetical protein D5272_03855 [bacterium D16-76]|nr:hypothetical protein [bacterium D16-76]